MYTLKSDIKNILYVGPFRFPMGDAAASRVLNNAKILKKLGYDVTFISFGGTPREEDKQCDGIYRYQSFQYVNTFDIDITPFRYFNLFNRFFNFIFTGRHSLKAIKNMICRTDIVIGYNTPFFFSIKLFVLCRKKNIPLISDITEWYAPKELSGGQFGLPYILNELNMRVVQNMVKNKIVISSYLNKYYSSLNIILPPLVDFKEKKWDNQPVLPYFNGIRLLYAGTPGCKDLLETMIDAILSSIKNGCKIQFIILGVSLENISMYKNFNEIPSFSENIIFCGRVKQTDVPAYYKTSDFSLIIREINRKNMAGFPTKLVESLASGCPVILNYTSDMEKYIKNEYNGFVLSEWTSQALEELLYSISTISKKEIKKMKTNAKKTGQLYFAYENYENELSGFLNRIH